MAKSAEDIAWLKKALETGGKQDNKEEATEHIRSVLRTALKTPGKGNLLFHFLLEESILSSQLVLSPPASAPTSTSKPPPGCKRELVSGDSNINSDKEEDMKDIGKRAKRDPTVSQKKHPKRANDVNTEKSSSTTPSLSSSDILYSLVKLGNREYKFPLHFRQEGFFCRNGRERPIMRWIIDLFPIPTSNCHVYTCLFCPLHLHNEDSNGVFCHAESAAHSSVTDTNFLACLDGYVNVNLWYSPHSPHWYGFSDQIMLKLQEQNHDRMRSQALILTQDYATVMRNESTDACLNDAEWFSRCLQKALRSEVESGKAGAEASHLIRTLNNYFEHFTTTSNKQRPEDDESPSWNNVLSYWCNKSGQ